MKPSHRKAIAAEIRAHIATSPEMPALNNGWGGYFRDESDVCITLAGKTRVRIRNHPTTLEEVARTIERGDPWRDPYTWTAPMEIDVLKMDAVKHCGTPAAALATIRRQLTLQGESMEPADVKRCERAASLIEAHIAADIRDTELKAAEDALEARIAAGREPDSMEIVDTDTEVQIVHRGWRYIGTVLSCKIGPHPILGAKHPTAVYTVRVTHKKETRKKRYAFHPIRPATMEKIIWRDVKILNPELATA